MERLDQLLHRRGLFPSREQARRAVMAGLVEVEGCRVDKPGTATAAGAKILVHGPAEPFVSRAGRKLAAALDHFGIDPVPRACIDVGASTGGFTDCLLQRGAARVYAVDVGYGQLDLRLREDSRVVVLERTNARYLSRESIPEPAELATMDVSFISIRKIAPALLTVLGERAKLLTLIKPQFEAGRGLVGRGGIVRDVEVRRRVVAETAAGVEDVGFELRGLFDSPVRGMKGNQETFGLFQKGSTT